jgi:hypothetical protein
LSVPFFFRCIADFTVFAADLPYFANTHLPIDALQIMCSLDERSSALGVQA